MQIVVGSILILALVAEISGLVIPRKLFEGHQVLKIHLKNEKDVEIFKELNNVLHLDIWRSPKQLPGTMDVRVSPLQKEAIVDLFGKHKIQHKMMIDDLQT